MNLNDLEASAFVVYTPQRIIQILDQFPEFDFYTPFINKVNQIYPNTKYFTNNLKLKNLDNKFELIQEDKEDVFLKNIVKLLPGSKLGDPDIDEVYFIYCDSLYPIMDINLTKELDERHKKYLSQYSYSENLPPGILPRAISREFVNSLPDNMTTSIHEFFFKNINQYDIEVFFEKPDLRYMRLNLDLSNKRSILLCNNILKTKPDILFKDLKQWVDEHFSYFRNFPSYIEIELFRGCEYKCTFCPRQSLNLSEDFLGMSDDLLKTIISNLNDIPSEFTVSLSGLGEPLLHPKLNDFLKQLDMIENIKEIIIETTLSPKIFSMDSIHISQKISWIINLPTYQFSTYSKLGMGSEQQWAHVLARLDHLIEKIPKSQIYIQTPRIQELDSEIEEYHQFAKKKGIQTIIQKYNRYIDLMPEKRVSDLTPIERNFCWHLVRDMQIQFDGQVTFCKQSQSSIGNLNQKSLIEIFQSQMIHSFNQYQNHLQDIPVSCANCDEWYTFNG